MRVWPSAFCASSWRPARRAAWLTFVVIGAGPTGVELAGTFAEIARHTLRGEFRRIDPHSARVVLVEGTERMLPAYPADLSRKAQLQLERATLFGRRRKIPEVIQAAFAGGDAGIDSAEEPAEVPAAGNR